ncbi:MAG TPA: BTAD domain-containing putative transcriptional regulator [Streptosporangiaceae bacterium]|nr:BTAD domain-containing putative transcriptional regulator [Streptosporangiaceae bacterium]
MPTGLEFCLLGPLTVSWDGAALPLPKGRQRVALAALLLRANHVVSLDELAQAMWGTDQPPSARVSTQNYVMRLRKALGAAGSRIATQTHGYLIDVSDGELDVARFETLLREARAAARTGRWQDCAGQAAAALALWRGEPLADIGSELLAARETPRLAELRLQAAETRIDADLHLGRHGEVIAELRDLVGSEPLRERLHALLMLALYRDSRQAEALAAYQQARNILVEELGAEPGPELQQLHQQILDADTDLIITDPATPAASANAPTGPVPRQLPAAVAHFTGRAAELQMLIGILDQAATGGPGTVVISAIGGTAGVGKTALAVHFAHQVAGRFGDGQLYVNLRGFDPAFAPAEPEAAIRGFLDALGVPPGRIPAGPEAQAALYRSLLSGRRVLIVADNARDEQQVRPLLPASPGSLVLVTSRNQLGGLAAADGARLLTLDVLSQEEAVHLLAARLGAARAAAEPNAVEQIASLCACLPLALAVAAARAAARPRFPLGALADELRDVAGRLDALDAGDPGSSVRAVFSWSTRQLSEQAARMFRLLGLHPGPDISVPAAASLAALAEADARALLRELARAHLITEHAPGRYSFHDLLRAYAADLARHIASQDERVAAIGRILDHYLHTAACAALLLDPAREPVILNPPEPGTAPEQPADSSQALAWFEAEHQVLLGAVGLADGSGFDAHAWQLPWAMATPLRARGHWHEWAATQRTALAAAARQGDTAAQALSSRLLAIACTELGDEDQAYGHFAGSLRLYRRLSDRPGEARVQQNLSALAGRQGRHSEAVRHAEQALQLFQAIGDKTGEAFTLNSVGWYYGLLGDYQQARTFCQQALALSGEVGHLLRLEAAAWDSLGYAEHHLGNLAEAAACYQRALALHREAGDLFNEANLLTHLGDTRHAAGDLTQAREAWQQALVILHDLEHPDASQVRVKLASANDHSSSNPSA